MFDFTRRMALDALQGIVEGQPVRGSSRTDGSIWTLLLFHLPEDGGGRQGFVIPALCQGHQRPAAKTME